MQEYLSIRLQGCLGLNPKPDFAVAGNFFPFKRPNTRAPWDGTVDFLGFADENALEAYCYGEEMIGKRLICVRDLASRMQERNGVVVFMGVQEYVSEKAIMEEILPGKWQDLADTSLCGHDYEGRKGWRLCTVFRTSPLCCFVQHPASGLFDKNVADALAGKLAPMLNAGYG